MTKLKDIYWISIFFHPRSIIKKLAETYSSGKKLSLTLAGGFGVVLLTWEPMSWFVIRSSPGRVLFDTGISFLLGILVGLVVYYGIGYWLTTASQRQKGQIGASQSQAIIAAAFLPVIVALILFVINHICIDSTRYIFHFFHVIGLGILVDLIKNGILLITTILSLLQRLIPLWFPIVFIAGIKEFHNAKWGKELQLIALLSIIAYFSLCMINIRLTLVRL